MPASATSLELPAGRGPAAPVGPLAPGLGWRHPAGSSRPGMSSKHVTDEHRDAAASPEAVVPFGEVVVPSGANRAGGQAQAPRRPPIHRRPE